MSDLAIVSGQLGRTARDVTGIAVRCPFGRPAVIETAPFLAGRPNPSLLYLTCPTATAAISGIEAGGGVKRFKAQCREDADLCRVLAVVTGAYRARRAAIAAAGDPRPEAGIGGPGGPEKASCLHAYTAALLAARAGWFGDGRDDAGAEPGQTVQDAAEAAWERMLPPRETLWCSDDRCARWLPQQDVTGASQPGGREPAGRRVAAVDIGTISVRLLVADVCDGRPEEVFRQAEITRLGEGLRPGEPLNAEARQRTADAVAAFMRQARDLGAARILLAGTSACREATDGQEFVAALGAEHQARAVVLSGDEEAAYAYAGASLDISDDPIVLDVGGGSTELIRRGAGGAVEAVSLPLGASRGTEHWIATDPPDAAAMQRLSAETAALVEPLRARFGAAAGESAAQQTNESASTAARAHLVGVAGTVTTLACLDAGLCAYDPEVTHLRALSLDAVERLAALLAAMTTTERAALPCVQAGRAPVIVAGALIVAAAMNTLGYTEMVVSERDILDGLALAAAC